MVRCKFRCHFKEEHKGIEGNIYGVSIKMHPAYGDSEENKKFWNYTPSGEINFYTTNINVANQIEQNKEYYIDITPAE